MTPEEIDSMYTEVTNGKLEASLIITPDGVFELQEDKTYKHYTWEEWVEE